MYTYISKCILKNIKYICKYVCIYICIYVNIYVHMQIYMYVCVCIFKYIYLHMYMYVYTYIWKYVYVHVYIYIRENKRSICKYVYFSLVVKLQHRNLSQKDPNLYPVGKGSLHYDSINTLE